MVLLTATSVLLCLALLPGLHFVSTREGQTLAWYQILTIALVCGSAAWACAIWWIPPGWLDTVVASTCALSVAAWLLPPRRRLLGHWIGRLRRTPARTVALHATAVLLVPFAIRFALVAYRPPPSTGDLTMHAYMTELIGLYNGMPPSHEPLLPISTFGQNSPGMHTLAAIVTRLTALPSYASALLAGAFGLGLLGLTLHHLLRALWPTAPSRFVLPAAVLAPFLTRNPQLYIPWGGLPTLLSDALMFFAIAEALSLVQRFAPLRALRLGCVGAGAVLTHLLPVLAGLWILAALGLCLTWQRRHQVRFVAALGNAALAAGFALGLLIPFIRVTPLKPDPQTVEWARGWIRLELQRAMAIQQPLISLLGVQHSDWAYISALVPHWAVFLGILPSLLLAVWWLLGLSRSPLQPVLASGVIFATLGLLHVASLLEFLPRWQGLYPSRIHVFLLVPVAFALVPTLKWIARCRAKTLACVALAVPMATFDIASVGPAGDNDHYGGLMGALVRTFTDRVNARVTDDDLAAMAWLRNRTPPNAVIANNAADGGQLIPAVAHRKILKPHYQFFWYRDEVCRWQRRTRPQYVFIGANPSPVYPIEWRTEELDKNPHAVLVFRRGNARIYRLHETGAKPPPETPTGP